VIPFVYDPGTTLTERVLDVGAADDLDTASIRNAPGEFIGR